MECMDVCLIQEHWLFNCQIDLFNEIHENLIGIGKSVDDKDPIQPSHMPRGYGGVGILWRKEIDHLISDVAIGNERIQCIEMRGTTRKLILVSIYMPCKGAPNNINDFQECVDILFEIVQTFGTSHTIIFGGDFNENLLTISNSTRSKYILDFMRECNFLANNVGKTFRLSNGKGSTAIDYILDPEQFHDALLHIRKLEIIGNVSDHYPVLASFSFKFSTNICKDSKTIKDQVTKKVNWNKVDKESYQNVLTTQLEKCEKNISNTYRIDETIVNINREISTAIKTVAPPRKLKYRRLKLKVMNEDIYKAIRANKKNTS